jgi:uncharacterized lipoprotein YajG
MTCSINVTTAVLAGILLMVLHGCAASPQKIRVEPPMPTAADEQIAPDQGQKPETPAAITG